MTFATLTRVIAFPPMGNEEKTESLEDRFGRRVRMERERQGWTQMDLAKALEQQGLSLHPSAIAKIELRDVERPRAIRLDEAHAIAQVFGLSIDDMHESQDDRVRWTGNRLRTWLAGLLSVLQEGQLMADEIDALIDMTDESERAGVKELLMTDRVTALVDSSTQTASTLMSALRHPSRAVGIDWSSKPKS